METNMRARQMMKKSKPVTPGTIARRINRKLKGTREILCITRGEQRLRHLGKYCLVNWWTNAIEAKHVELDALGRYLRVLHPNEYVSLVGARP
jgi:hypothetical protein